jgi:8-oxo-dGTP pyrophosphatase MutT (NUDIX family)
MEDEKTVGVVVNVLRIVEGVGQFLFLRRSGGAYKNQWWPVAGNVEVGENPVQAVLRELKEETDLIPLEIYRLGMDVPHVDGKSKLEGFVAFVEPGSLVRLNYEHSEFGWLGVPEAIEGLPAYALPFIRHIERRFLISQPQMDLRLWPV